MHYQVANSGGSREQLHPLAPFRAPTGSMAVIGRSDLASHLKLSARSVDRFIARHRLKNGEGRRVLVSYAWCLVKLRRQSTRSMVPVPPVQGNTPAPLPIQPGEELLLVATSDGFGSLAVADRPNPTSATRPAFQLISSDFDRRPSCKGLVSLMGALGNRL